MSATNTAELSAFWRVLAEKGWHGVTMRAVASEAGMALSDLRRHYVSPFDLLLAHGRAVDAEVIGGTIPDDTSPARDRLFDVLMRRIDALQPDRAGVVRLMRDLPTSPLLALWLLPRLTPSMAWMLEAAGIDTAGPGGLLRAKGLVTVWLAALRAWEKDESQDLSATMAALDRALDRAERMAKMFGFADRDSAAAAASPAGALPPPEAPTAAV
ncbi:TetR family transcriptional regulator [Roseococcus sp. YIM B11640]|uniref:TetR family transcriptional regulator n=1 Tax=Roseococcus sp. YIM B11640 TaxID=3133973 RepID=UPI003C7A4129